MMKALVTGSSGFIGYWVARELLSAQFEVKVLVRSDPPSHLNELPVEICRGDLRDKDSLEKALQGCDHLFHVAAHYKLWEKNPQVFYDINVEGTRNLLSLCADKSISKIVYTSSVATIKLSSDKTPSNEKNEGRLEEMVGHYKRSKYLAEMVVREFIEEGAPIVIVNPSAQIGRAHV